MTTAVEIQHLTKDFSSFRALDNVSLTVRQG